MTAEGSESGPAGLGLLQLAALRKSYGNSIAVDGIDLDLQPGEFVTLLGPSGCGKTTTLMMVAGFETPTDGAMLFDGKSLVGQPAYRRGFGMVFQNYALFPHMTVAQNVGYPMRMRGVRGEARAKAVADALELVRLGGMAERYPAQLSGGQQQRVALARALVFRPRLLLMDEPLGALDRNLRDEMQLEIVRIQRDSGAATIFVTHDQGEALQMSDRIAVMRSGRIEQIDTPKRLYDAPATAFVARFLGESNLLDYTRVAAGEALVIGGARFPLAHGAPDAGVFVLRPERIRLGKAIPDNALGLQVEVIGKTYRGSEILITLAAGSARLSALVPNRSGEQDFAPGEAVSAWWSTEDMPIARP